MRKQSGVYRCIIKKSEEICIENESYDILIRECLKLIPHKKFSFSKIWLLAAKFEIRQLNLNGARQILGDAIGKAPKDKLLKKYIEIELQLCNFDRCRKLYEKYLEWSPENCYAWSKYAELERSLAETDRARAIFELAIAQPALDMPELSWKAYIEFEKSEGEYERTRALNERLLDRTKQLKVWISYVKFEAFDSKEDDGGSDISEDDVDEQKKQSIQRARRIFEKAINYYMSAPELKEERAMLLEEWLNMESSIGELGDASLVQAKLLNKLKRRRQIVSDDGLATGSEELYDYLFPEEAQTTNLKILEAAYKWKKKKISADNFQILSKSKLEKCEKSTDTANLNCTTKIVLNLAVPSGSSGGEASIVTEVVEVEKNST
ncbi:hypothetical protein LWI29_025053 [Acer saccharum]|uniref:Uncharacterized protein n=1 Tax=Acer saccharum TaxID=4024 RepID=A0AA39S360_ACESA|nr:hypothetical protein LWI29_025053 [Acer saccharum]